MFTYMSIYYDNRKYTYTLLHRGMGYDDNIRGLLYITYTIVRKSTYHNDLTTHIHIQHCTRDTHPHLSHDTHPHLSQGTLPQMIFISRRTSRYHICLTTHIHIHHFTYDTHPHTSFYSRHTSTYIIYLTTHIHIRYSCSVTKVSHPDIYTISNIIEHLYHSFDKHLVFFLSLTDK